MKHKNFIIIFLFIFSFSCGERQNLEPNFRNEILKYQKLFPLSDKKDSIFSFYSLKFSKVKNDTIFRISRTEVFSKAHFEHYEVFKDKKMKPTVITDFDNLALKLIKEYPMRKGERLLKTGKSKSINPYYVYKLKEGKIIFLKEENY